MSKAIPSTAAGPLKKLRIIDLGTMVAGPVICTYLGDFGADIIKVEQPNGGDTVRALGPFKDGESLLWQVEARNVAHAYEECVARVRRMDRPLIAGSVGGGAWAVDAVIE